MISDKSHTINPDTVLAGIFLVLSLVFPILFHVVHLGFMFLPMFFPIALCGLLVSPSLSAAVGLLAPLISALLTGMPPIYPPIAPLMMAEGFVLGGTIALLRRKAGWGIYPSLISGIILQRIIMVLAVFVVSPAFHLPPEIFSISLFASGIPGVFLQLVAIPPLVYLIEPRINRLKEIT